MTSLPVHELQLTTITCSMGLEMPYVNCNHNKRMPVVAMQWT